MDQITIKTRNPMSSLLVLNRVYRLEIQSVMLVFNGKVEVVSLDIEEWISIVTVKYFIWLNRPEVAWLSYTVHLSP
jgi:hypothetical protein